MTPENVDRRVRKTRTTLRICLGKLLRTKRIQDISVKELADMADINRGTFYLHYRDVYDLLSHIESEVLKQFSELLEQYALPSLSDDPKPLLCELFRLIRDNADLTECLIGPNGDIHFLNRLRAIFNEKVITPWLQTLNLEGTVDYSYWFAFISEGFIGIIKLWLENDASVPPEEMADKCVSMIRAGFRAFTAPPEST
ncbi:MAG: TetR family transcriptional regulator C-terminal domain-containing protein [Stomatobaculum sp.]|nr:TetR family transcriptional regulator C-terminal domain-containing protein [Stomatobaculum sp.]